MAATLTVNVADLEQILIAAEDHTNSLNLRAKCNTILEYLAETQQDGTLHVTLSPAYGRGK